MKITRIEIYQAPIKLKEPFIISLGALTHAENVLVIIRTDDGIIGLGECSPFRTIHGESMETCFTVAGYLANVLCGTDPLDIESCSKKMNACIYGNTSIKSAFDMALYDIASKHASMPLYEFLGGKKNKKLYTDYTVSLNSIEKMVADAIKIKSEGYPAIKVKLGGTKEMDVERIKKIRKAVGNEIPLRIDANQGWNQETAIAVLNELAPCTIQHCEEPISRKEFMRLPEIRKSSPIPIMADESCCDHFDAQRLIELKACDRFNIKLGKSSGIFNALKIIRLAEENNIELQIGGFLESRLGFSASAHLALCSDNILYYDFDTPLMFSEDYIIGGIEYKPSGLIEIPQANGLGITIDERYLKKLTSISIT